MEVHGLHHSFSCLLDGDLILLAHCGKAGAGGGATARSGLLHLVSLSPSPPRYLSPTLAAPRTDTGSTLPEWQWRRGGRT